MESIKFDELRELYCDDSEEMIEIATIFCEHTKSLLQKLQTYMNNSDEYMYLKLLHQLKGCVGYLYLLEFVKVISSLELEVESKSIVGVIESHQNLMNQLIIIIEKVESEIVMVECI